MKITTYFLIIFLLSTGFSTVTISKDNNINIFTDEITISEPVFQEYGNKFYIGINESNSYTFQPNEPLLPVITKVYTFPLGTKILDINIDYDTKIYQLNKKISLCPFPSFNTKKVKSISEKNVFSRSLNNFELFSPDEAIFIQKGAGLKNSKHVLFVSIKIVPQYNSFTNLLSLPQNIIITFETLTSETPINSIDEYDMVIITPEKFSSNIDLLIDHKIEFGINTFKKTYEDIINEFSGSDDVEKIKYFIKDAIERFGISYVLLIGNYNELPIRKTEGFVWEEIGVMHIASDLYYADIYNESGDFCSWDTNNNGIYGEFTWDDIWNDNNIYWDEGIIDNVDLYPDVHIGRIPCKNKYELNSVINKIIAYENKAYGKVWFNNVVLMGGDTDPGGYYEGEIITNKVALEMEKNGFIPKRLWASNNQLTPYIINSEISKGAGFVSYEGHGNPIGIMTYSPNGVEEIVYTIFHQLLLFNGRKLPIIYLDACSTAQLDFTINNLKLPCFAWSLLKKSYGGSISTIGSTELSYSVYDNIGNTIAGGEVLHLEFFKSYKPETYVGNMLTEAKIEYLNSVGKDCLLIEEINLFGDPSLRVGGYS
jgi:hypothetical protein